MTEDHEGTAGPDESAPMSYEPPALTVLGTITELTMSTSGTGLDAGALGSVG